MDFNLFGNGPQVVYVLEMQGLAEIKILCFKQEHRFTYLFCTPGHADLSEDTAIAKVEVQIPDVQRS